MSELICRICLDSDIRLYQITGSPVQDVYEKLSNKKVDENGQYCACYICYHHLKNCQDLAIKSRKSEELLAQVMTKTSKFNLKSISAVDRHTYGLVNSLAVTKVYSIQIPEYDNIIKTENQSDTVKNEVTNNSPAVDEAIEHQSTIKMEELSDSDAEEANDVPDEEEIEIDAAVQKEENSEMDSDDGPAEASTTTREERQLKKKQHSKQYMPAFLERTKADEIFITLDKNDPKFKRDVTKNCDSKDISVKNLFGYQLVTIKPKAIIDKISIFNGKYKEVNSEGKNYSGEELFSRSIETQISEPTGKYFRCRYCNYTCTESSILDKHFLTHKRDKPKKSFKCQYCNHTFTAVGALTIHIRTHTGEKPFKCEYCNYTCKANSHLVRHTKTHTREKPFECQYCSYRCSQKCTLNIHYKRRHNGENPFKCRYCDYKSAVNSSLKKHVKTHTEEKPFKCQYCSHACSSKRDLVDHIRTHTGEKPFKCHHCSRAFSGRSNFKRHIKTHKGGNPH